jgi:hypothetical protein
MRKPNVKKQFRVVLTLEDGRKIYLSTKGKLLLMPKAEADFWARVSRQVHSITIDEMVYSQDLQFYNPRSYFLERLMPFTRVVATALERADVPVDPKAFIVGGIRAATVGSEYQPRRDYRNTVLVII